jgi:hypothetical protein
VGDGANIEIRPGGHYQRTSCRSSPGPSPLTTRATPVKAASHRPHMHALCTPVALWPTQSAEPPAAPFERCHPSLLSARYCPRRLLGVAAIEQSSSPAVQRSSARTLDTRHSTLARNRAIARRRFAARTRPVQPPGRPVASAQARRARRRRRRRSPAQLTTSSTIASACRHSEAAPPSTAAEEVCPPQPRSTRTYPLLAPPQPARLPAATKRYVRSSFSTRSPQSPSRPRESCSSTQHPRTCQLPYSGCQQQRRAKAARSGLAPAALVIVILSRPPKLPGPPLLTWPSPSMGPRRCDLC